LLPYFSLILDQISLSTDYSCPSSTAENAEEPQKAALGGSRRFPKRQMYSLPFTRTAQVYPVELAKHLLNLISMETNTYKNEGFKLCVYSERIYSLHFFKHFLHQTSCPEQPCHVTRGQLDPSCCCCLLHVTHPAPETPQGRGRGEPAEPGEPAHRPQPRAQTPALPLPPPHRGAAQGRQASPQGSRVTRPKTEQARAARKPTATGAHPSQEK